MAIKAGVEVSDWGGGELRAVFTNANENTREKEFGGHWKDGGGGRALG